MNREQAITILLALGRDVEDRRAAGVVLDLLQDGAPEVTPFPGSPLSMSEANVEIERLRKVTEDQERSLAGWLKLWRRIEKLIGKEPVHGPESVIDRIAFLAEVEKTRPTQHCVDELQMELHRVEVQRDDLLTAARKFVEADDSVRGRYALVLADVVAKINAREDT